MTAQIPTWMKRFEQQDLLEEKEQLEIPTKLLDPSCRNFIWWLCKQYSIMTDGVMGSVCSLLERYISKKIKLFSHLPRRSNEWRQIKHEIVTRIPLLASVSLALTTKMMSSERQLHAKTIREVLAVLNPNYTLEQINAAEMDVLSCLGFYIPMFTNVEKAIMMAVDVGMSGLFLEAVALVTEVAEYYRSIIQDEVIAVAFCMREDNTVQRLDTTNVRHMHLVAGSVIATGRFLMFSGPDPLPRLAFLAQCSRVYIKCIGNLVHNRLMVEYDSVYPQPSRKRKLED